jgi:hypothetical protein
LSGNSQERALGPQLLRLPGDRSEQIPRFFELRFQVPSDSPRQLFGECQAIIGITFAQSPGLDFEKRE